MVFEGIHQGITWASPRDRSGSVRSLAMSFAVAVGFTARRAEELVGGLGLSYTGFLLSGVVSLGGALVIL